MKKMCILLAAVCLMVSALCGPVQATWEKADKTGLDCSHCHSGGRHHGK
jgi:hypothetical protein